MGDPIRALELETVANQIKKDKLLETVQITGKYLMDNLHALEAKHKGKIKVGEGNRKGERERERKNEVRNSIHGLFC
jgi:4-aminobutyrate aminotransferase / (S)-3-amino-2-methylpropionate transaminase